MSTYIGPVTTTIIEHFVKEMKKKENKEKIMKNVVDPLVKNLATRYYPYFMMTIIILMLIVILLVAVLVVTVTKKP